MLTDLSKRPAGNRRASEVARPRGLAYYNGRARVLHQKGELEGAVKDYKRVVLMAPPGHRFGRSSVRSCSRLLVKSGRRDAAVRWLRVWLEKDPEDRAARSELVSVLCSLGRFSEAHEVFVALVTAGAPSPKELLLGVLCAHAVGKEEDAQRLLRALSETKTVDQVTRNAIVDLLEAGIELRESLAPYLESEQPSAAFLRHILGLGHVALASRRVWAKDKAGAIASLKRAVTIAPDGAAVQKQAASMLYELGMYHDEIACRVKAAELDPIDAYNLGNLGWSLYLVGRYDEAMEASLRALELGLKLAYVHANVGLLHVLKRDLDKAMPSYEKAVELDPDQIQRWAIDDLLDLLKKRPETTEAHYALGFCYDKKGDKATAREYYQKYVDAVKDGQFVEKAKKRIAELSQKPAEQGQ